MGFLKKNKALVISGIKIKVLEKGKVHDKIIQEVFYSEGKIDIIKEVCEKAGNEDSVKENKKVI